MFVLGCDIGYSNLKVAYGFKGNDASDTSLNTKVLPVGAGPEELMPRTLSGGVGDCIRVLINNEHWVAGVEPDRLQSWERELHEDYPSTSVYMALYYAALVISEQDVIDVLVTGLPVRHYKNIETRKALKERLEGEHKVAPKRKVLVKKVVVVPQPAGTYLDVMNSTQDPDMIEMIQDGLLVAIDPGYFSVDWVFMQRGEIRDHSSDSSLKAMSKVLQLANDLIHKDYGVAPTAEKLEKALREGKGSIFLSGQKVMLHEYIDRASKTTSSDALISMKKSMRTEDSNADVVILAGGGADSYKSAAQELFPRSKIVVPDQSVLSNARGFWYCV